MCTVRLERFLSCVCALVSDEILRRSERGATDITIVWFLSSVSVHVTLETVRAVKSFLTDLTYIQFSSMVSHVAL